MNKSTRIDAKTNAFSPRIRAALTACRPLNADLNSSPLMTWLGTAMKHAS
jgi:hypothetical protein